VEILKFAFLFLTATSANAKELQYFESKINFWSGSETQKESSALVVDSTSVSEEKFPWKTYLDPKNKEFFREGDYTPPEPFMEVARNPTDENIKQWFELMKKKNDLQTKLQTRMQEYMTKNTAVKPLSADLSRPMTSQTINKKEPDTAIDPSRFRIRMYFESTCPHCKRMFGVLKELQTRGFQVEALQVDRGPVMEVEKVVPIAQADPAELKKHGVDGVPFLLVADTKRKALLPAIQGYHDFGEILRLIKAASRI